jgi:hypothetical protein
MNESHYPPSPSYYRHGNADCRDLVTPSYWTDSALVHLFRAGRKNGEPFADAVRNAFVCLALWFRSQSLPVPFYSAELDRLQSRIAELESAALTAVDRPGAPALDAPPVEWTDAELREWATRTHGEPSPDADDRFIVWGESELAFDSLDSTWNTGSDHRWMSATEAARILNAIKPDPLRDLLEVKTDDDFKAWLKMAGYDQTPDSFHGDRIIRWMMPNTVPVHWDTVTLPGKPWRISVPGVFCAKAEVAARTLHRILTGSKP